MFNSVYTRYNWLQYSLYNGILCVKYTKKICMFNNLYTRYNYCAIIMQISRILQKKETTFFYSLLVTNL